MGIKSGDDQEIQMMNLHSNLNLNPNSSQFASTIGSSSASVSGGFSTRENENDPYHDNPQYNFNMSVFEATRATQSNSSNASGIGSADFTQMYDDEKEKILLNPQNPQGQSNPSSQYLPALQWRCELLLSQQHWESWFRGFTHRFLAMPCPKALIFAASPERADPFATNPELLVAQMQGQLQVAPIRAGHCLHEEAYSETATAIHRFLSRLPYVRTWEMNRKNRQI